MFFIFDLNCNLLCNFYLYIFHKRNNACCLLWLRKNLLSIENLALDLEGCTGHRIYHCVRNQAHPWPSYGKDESCSLLIPTPIDFVEPGRSLQSISFYLPLLCSILNRRKTYNHQNEFMEKNIRFTQKINRQNLEISPDMAFCFS